MTLLQAQLILTTLIPMDSAPLATILRFMIQGYMVWQSAISRPSVFTKLLRLREKRLQ